MENPVLAREDVLSRVDGDVEFLCELVSDFIKSFPEQFADLTAAVKKQDLQAVARRAHSIKGALRNLGGLKAGDVAFKIEGAAKAGNISEIDATLLQLEADVKEFEKEFRAFAADQVAG